jgi:very-short-patch-repair endonuclease
VAPKVLSQSVDQAIIELADRQHRIVTTPQLLGLGLTRADVKSRVRRGWLTRIYRGVYAVGTRRLTKYGRWMAAVLACGDRAALSGRAAADLWGIHDSGGEICVTVASGAAGRPGISLRRSAAFDATVHRGIPVTTVGWTLVDLATVVSCARLLDATDEAERLRLWSWAEFDELAKKRRRARGIGLLAAARAIRDPLAARTRSWLERKFLALCRRSSLPAPGVNVELLDGRYVADFLWDNAKLIIETDGHETHGTAAAFQSDRDRDTALAAYGYQTLRFTGWDVLNRPTVVVHRIRLTLRSRGLEV